MILVIGSLDALVDFTRFSRRLLTSTLWIVDCGFSPKNQLLINGEFMEGDGAEAIINPSTGITIAKIKEASLAQVAQATKAAASAFQSWSKTPRVSWILCKRRLITAEASSPQTE